MTMRTIAGRVMFFVHHSSCLPYRTERRSRGSFWLTPRGDNGTNSFSEPLTPAGALQGAALNNIDKGMSALTRFGWAVVLSTLLSPDVSAQTDHVQEGVYEQATAIATLQVSTAQDLRKPQLLTDSRTPLPSTVLWNQCRDGAEMPTLHTLAERSRPVLWFSRDEPLVALNGALPSEWPRKSGASVGQDLVYYRVTKLKSYSSDRDLVTAWQQNIDTKLWRFITTKRINPEVIANVALDMPLLNAMQEIVIRYLFYYSNELGAGSHPHDLESIELRLVVEQANNFGDPNPPPPDTSTRCRQIRVATFYGAAHGLGLYTNVLDLTDVLSDRLSEGETVGESAALTTPITDTLTTTPSQAATAAAVRLLTRTDPFWPLVVLVEEGKHASAPDRNGDGVFTPNFDVNRYAADAWGARDTMRSRQLSPVFRADTFKQRIPALEIDSGGNLIPAQPGSPERLLEFAEQLCVAARRSTAQESEESTDAAPDTIDTACRQLGNQWALSDWSSRAFATFVKYEYALRRPTQDVAICGEPLRPASDRRDSMKDYASEYAGHAYGLLNGKEFCADANVHARWNGMDVLRRIGFGGAHNGYTRWWERFSGSIRYDGGLGWTFTVPVGLEVPGIGGWLVGRFSGPWWWREAPSPQLDPSVRLENLGILNSRKGIDALYMPSAARFADWYVGGGVDHGFHEAELDGILNPVIEAGWRPALEAGMKFRFPLIRWSTFLGGRLGVRTNGGVKGLHNTRLVFEIGAGIW